MAKKFSKKAFREWLDCLAKVVVKTRDGFTCRLNITQKCAGKMQPLDNNCQWMHLNGRTKGYAWRWDLLNAVCGCGQCHAWAHANPAAFGVWLYDKYPHLWEYLQEERPNRTWREEDFKAEERKLLLKALDLKVDVANIPDRGRYYQRRYQKRIDAVPKEDTP